MSARSGFERVTREARRDCLAIVTAEVKKNLPEGWRVVLAVGWGISTFDASGTITGEDEKRFPKRLKKALALASDFVDIYGPGNEQITG
ncbi:hypothetical protein BAJUN_01170 [Bajunvirus bajun]|uniref:Uncharacterized protein n=1 Tax=Brevundimonas phage vB_BgoS-Bajun TaxID=2948594 RepID=A0A9E7N704_9CAUD|nr:hypothetical protein BAJUN_01170 [Brevundimonas phage vB_BgoS-Bajun]